MTTKQADTAAMTEEQLDGVSGGRTTVIGTGHATT